MSQKRALGFKKLGCKKCGEIVQKVDEKVDSITCSKCVQADLRGYPDITREEWFRLDAQRREAEIVVEETVEEEEG
jgi:hypothetical protein